MEVLRLDQWQDGGPDQGLDHEERLDQGLKLETS